MVYRIIASMLLCLLFYPSSGMAVTCDLGVYDLTVEWVIQTCHAICDDETVVNCVNTQVRIETLTYECIENGDPNCVLYVP